MKALYAEYKSSKGNVKALYMEGKKLEAIMNRLKKTDRVLYDRLAKQLIPVVGK